jgi:hypothetical protein
MKTIVEKLDHEYNIEIRQELAMGKDADDLEKEKFRSKILSKAKLYLFLLEPFYMEQKCFKNELKQVAQESDKKKVLVLKECSLNVEDIQRKMSIKFLPKNVEVIETSPLSQCQSKMAENVAQKCEDMLRNVSNNKGGKEEIFRSNQSSNKISN